MTHLVLTFVSLALLLAVLAFLKERRLRLALQQILQRLLKRWRPHAQTKDSRSADCQHSPDDWL